MEFQKYDVVGRINIKVVARVGLLGLLLPSLIAQAGFAGEKPTADVANFEGKDVFTYQQALVEGDTALRSVPGVTVLVEENASYAETSPTRVVPTSSKSRAATSRKRSESPVELATLSKKWRSGRARPSLGPVASNSLALAESRSRLKRKQKL